MGPIDVNTKALGCDDVKARFEVKLGKLAKATPEAVKKK
jgi:hypothetical protein